MSNCSPDEIDAHSTLRRETRDLHDRVDRLMSVERVSSPGGYARMLQVHAAVVPEVERYLAASGHLDDLPEFGNRMRADALRSDLDNLGLDMPAPAHTPLPDSRAGAAGFMYVLEGSRLGARFILRRLGEDTASTAFLRHGEASAYWPSFLKWLREEDWTTSQLDDMRSAAIALFAAYASAADGLES